MAQFIYSHHAFLFIQRLAIRGSRNKLLPQYHRQASPSERRDYRSPNTLKSAQFLRAYSRQMSNSTHACALPRNAPPQPNDMGAVGMTSQRGPDP
jgi:hypothetical protein